MNTNFTIKWDEDFASRIREILKEYIGPHYPQGLLDDIFAKKKDYVENPTKLKVAIDDWVREHSSKPWQPKPSRKNKNAPRTDGEFHQ